MKMEYTAEVLRGWPADGAMDRNETIKAGVTLSNGDVVEMQSDGTVDKVGTGASSNKVGLVIRGNGDSTSSVNSNKAVVLWSNYIVRVKNYGTGTWVPGAAVSAGGASNGGKFHVDAGSDPLVGFCVKVQTASATEDAHVVIVVR